MQNIFVEPRKSYVHELVVIEGLSRAGKSVLLPIVSSLKRVEMWQQYPIVDTIPYLYGLNLMNEDLAIALLQSQMDMHLYYQMIGRKVNFRKNDMSSIWKSKDIDGYFERILLNDEKIVLDKLINKELKPILPITMHDLMSNVDIMFKAFPNLKIISMQRNPVDIAYSLYNNGMGTRHGNCPRLISLAFKVEDGPVPWYATSWSKKYIELSPMDRVIECILFLSKENQKKYKSLQANVKNKIIFVYFENLITKPEKNIDKICEFIKTSSTAYTKVAMMNVKVPRDLSLQDLGEGVARPVSYEKKINFIKNKSTKNCYNSLMNLKEQYEEQLYVSFK
jgi:hypothetical protein